jgi:hypothetical protein
MKTITCHGYAIITFLTIILTSSLLYSQSSIVFDTGTTIDVGNGADIRADMFTFNGTRSGSGTFSLSPLAVEPEANLEIPKEFSLSQNYPNPFNPSTTIRFSLPSRSFVSLKVFDVLGREVSILLADEMPAGTYARQWNAAELPSGVYFYRLQSDKFTETKKFVLLK